MLLTPVRRLKLAFAAMLALVLCVGATAAWYTLRAEADFDRLYRATASR